MDDKSWLYRAGQGLRGMTQRSAADLAETRGAIAYPFQQLGAGFTESADSVIAGSQSRVDAARTAARNQPPAAADDSMQGQSPYPKGGNSQLPGMYSAMERSMQGAQAPSAAEEAAAQAAQAAQIQQRRQGVQNEWLKQQGIPEYARLGTPDTAGLPQRARPGSTTEGDYSGFAAPGTRIFGTANSAGRVNSFTGAGLPSMESVGGGSGSHTQKVGATLAKMSEKLAGMSGATDVRSMMERKSLRRSIAELSGVHNTLAGFEHGMASVGETTRGSKQRERVAGAGVAVGAADAYMKALAAHLAGDPEALAKFQMAQHGYPLQQYCPQTVFGGLSYSPYGDTGVQQIPGIMQQQMPLW